MCGGIEGIVLEERDHPAGRHAGGHRSEEVGSARGRYVVNDSIEVNQICGSGLRAKPSKQFEAYPVGGIAGRGSFHAAWRRIETFHLRGWEGFREQCRHIAYAASVVDDTERFATACSLPPAAEEVNPSISEKLLRLSAQIEPAAQLGFVIVRVRVECRAMTHLLRRRVLAHARRIPKIETKKLDRIVWNANAVTVTPGTTSRIVWA